MQNTGTQYFYVSGADPSGLPGAFVVSEKEAKGKLFNHAIAGTIEGGDISLNK